jgi:Zn-dependent metalloprotease
MSMKKTTLKSPALTASMLLALAGSGAVVWFAAGDSDNDDTRQSRTSPEQPPEHADATPPASSPSRWVAFHAGTRRAGVSIDRNDLEKHPAVGRARDLLRQEKIKAATATGRNRTSIAPTLVDQAIEAERYAPRDVVVEADGSEHVRFDRTYRGLPVIGGDLVTHARDGQLQSTSQTLDLQVPAGDTLASAPRPALPDDEAIVAASKHFKGTFLKAPTSRTVYYAHGNTPVLAYEVTFAGVTTQDFPTRERIYIDADTRAFLGRDNSIHSAQAARTTGFTITRGEVPIDTIEVTADESDGRGAGYLLVDKLRGDGSVHDTGGTVVDFYFGGGDFSAPPMFDQDNAWGNEVMSNAPRTGVEAHYGLARTWDYYKTLYGRNGIFDDGKGVKSFINMTFSMFYFYDMGGTNAFWDGENRMMAYGNGDWGLSNPVVALDVAGHEMSHGVNQATANLIYAGDPGGLNEANSDIHGTLVEFFDDHAKDPVDYMIGENVLLSGEPLRYMFKPSLDTRSFDCYPEGGFDPENQDAHDPHLTSGVGNHFFYLLAEGARVPRSHRKSLLPADLVCNGNTRLKRITRNTAGQIWYRAHTLYMTSQTSYPQAREATQQAAADLHRKGLLTKKAMNAVACAWDAVDVPLPEGSTAEACRI